MPLAKVCIVCEYLRPIEAFTRDRKFAEVDDYRDKVCKRCRQVAREEQLQIIGVVPEPQRPDQPRTTFSDGYRYVGVKGGPLYAGYVR